ncbi:MAG: hypothetical protein IPG83_02530 [Novosphingobium sp.]|nr:hypothetical protein [Novosphingobium sp.]
MTVNAGRAAFKLAALPADDFPVTVAPIADEALSAFTVPAARFLSDLAALAPCISTEEARYYLNGIAMQVRDLGGRERLAMVATDGSNIGAASRPIPAGAERLPDSIVPRKTVATIRHAAKLVPDCEAVAVEVEGNRARFALGPVVIESKLIDGTFPQWERAFEGLAPTGETEAPLFPELIPGTPLAAMAKLGKGAAIEWQDATDGKFGTVPGDDGLIFAALNLRADIAEPLKGYRYSHEQGDYAASEYLTGLAVKRHGAIPHDWNVHLVTDAGGYQGLTVGKTEYIAGHYVETPNWETLAIERVYIEGRSEYLEGAYSVVMPRERAERRSDVRLEIDGDSTVYPIATNSGGKIHLSADQVRNIAGDSVFETLALTIAGKVVYVLAWLFAQGDSRFLTVRSDGRCFAGKDRHKAQYLTLEQVEAALRGEEVVEAVEICPPEAAESDSGPCVVAEAPEAPEALCEAVSGQDEPSREAEQLPADPVADLAERVAALEARLEALAVETGPVAENTNNSSPEFIAAPSGEVARPARTAAHERAIRRAWAERKARRGAQGGLRYPHADAGAPASRRGIGGDVRQVGGGARGAGYR